MFVSDQARCASSNLCTFLDARLPRRHLITEAWQRQAGSAAGSEIGVAADRRHLGQALEMRIGLDVAAVPGYWPLLGFLAPAECAAVLTAAGFEERVNEHLPETATTDPMLQSWARTSHPLQADTDDQQAALRGCLAATSMDQLAHKLRGPSFSVQTQRGFLQKFGMSGPPRPADTTRDSMMRCLTHLWDGYLRHGRRQLTSLGDRVVLAPELAPGFAVADLVVGRTLVDVKVSRDPGSHLEQWLNQVLAYALIDRWNVLHLNQIALYLGWHALLLTVSIDELLVTAASGPTPELPVLRAEFHEALREDIDQGAYRRLATQYPIPASALQP